MVWINYQIIAPWAKASERIASTNVQYPSIDHPASLVATWDRSSYFTIVLGHIFQLMEVISIVIQGWGLTPPTDWLSTHPLRYIYIYIYIYYTHTYTYIYIFIHIYIYIYTYIYIYIIYVHTPFYFSISLDLHPQVIARAGPQHVQHYPWAGPEGATQQVERYETWEMASWFDQNLLSIQKENPLNSRYGMIHPA